MAELKVKPEILTTYLVIAPGQTLEQAESVTRMLPREPGYRVLAALIEPLLGGAHLEHVNVLHNGKHLDMFVDEVGLLKHLPRNETATTIYRAANLAGKSSVPPVPDPEMLSFICGTAILFQRRVWF